MEEENTTNSEEVLKDAALVQPQEQGTATSPEAPAPVEIGSLGEAMQAINAAKSKAVESAVSEGITGTDSGEQPKASIQGDSGSDASTLGSSDPQANASNNLSAVPQPTEQYAQSGTGGAGESTSYDEVYDSAAGVAEVKQQLRTIAADAVRKEFAEKNIRLITINDIVKVDEHSGTKEFINPDTNRPFSSSNPRSEAQAFVKDYNEELEQQFRQRCNQAMPQVEKSYAPILEFHEFLPRWQKMDPFRQEMFEELVAGHELTDNQGNVVAYDCNLNNISDQMEKQIDWLLKQQKSLTPQAEAAAEVRQPAVAAKAQTASVPGEEKEYDLSNMADALKYYNSKKKGNK